MTTMTWAPAALGILLLAGSTPPTPQPVAPKAKGILADSTGKEVGTIDAEMVGDGLRIVVKVHDIPPGNHGVHVHAGTSCGKGSFEDAGPHFDPMNAGKHAGLNGDGHAGDLGNISVGADGKGKLDVVSHDLTIEAGKTSIMGKPIVLHTMSDNLTDKPENGGTDGRLACGVLGT